MSEIVIAILASSGLWGVIQYLVSRRDKTAEIITKPQLLKLRGESNEFFQEILKEKQTN